MFNYTKAMRSSMEAAQKEMLDNQERLLEADLSQAQIQVHRCEIALLAAAKTRNYHLRRLDEFRQRHRR